MSCERTFHNHKEPEIETFIACFPDNQTKQVTTFHPLKDGPTATQTATPLLDQALLWRYPSSPGPLLTLQSSSAAAAGTGKREYPKTVT